ncbi:MAG: glycosyltransferase family 2 protein [Cyclobacteriaceae bacterium]|nr:glycosyltransferase family 2 protein [Cyclobacteriaceae bacterium]
MSKLVSIITPLHNSAPFVTETIESVINQTYPHWEMIIVDDCSEDKGTDIVKEYAKKDRRIRLIENESNLGPAKTRNRAIEQSKGDYIAFLDSDDLWAPTKLAIQLEFMQSNKYAFTYTEYFKISEDGKPQGTQLIPNKLNYKELLKTCPIGCLTVIYDAKQLGKVYMPIIDKRQDYALWLKILKTLPYAHGLKEKLATYRVRKSSVSSNKLKAAGYQWRVYREIESLGLIKSCFYFVNYFLSGIKKTYLQKRDN